jgi:hypothetical protein
MKTRVRTIKLSRGDVRALRIYRNSAQPGSSSTTKTGECRSSKPNLACPSAKRSGRRWVRKMNHVRTAGRNLEKFLPAFYKKDRQSLATHVDDRAGLRVPARVRLVVADHEGAKSANVDAFVALECREDRGEDLIHDGLRGKQR